MPSVMPQNAPMKYPGISSPIELKNDAISRGLASQSASPIIEGVGKNILSSAPSSVASVYAAKRNTMMATVFPYPRKTDCDFFIVSAGYWLYFT